MNVALMWLILKWYTILEDFCLLDSVCYCDDVMTILKVWLFQYRDPDIRLISQIDIVMCFIYNYISNVMAISRAMSLRYRHNIRMSTGVLCKKLFLEISQNSEENTCARDPGTGVLLWILWNFQELPFLQNISGRLLLYLLFGMG